MRQRKLEILSFYGVLISVVTAFWAVIFKFACPHFIIYGVIIVMSVTSIISALLITKCFIEIDNENKDVVTQIQKSLRDL